MATPEQLEALRSQLQAMALRQGALEAQLQVARQEAAEARHMPAPPRTRRALVDMKGLGVPPQLEAHGRNWATFQFRVEYHLELIHRGARGALVWAVEQENEIIEADRDDDLVAMYPPSMRPISTRSCTAASRRSSAASRPPS